MRRRDLITLTVLGGVIFYAWQQLKPPTLDEGELTVDDSFLTSFSKWSGSLTLAQRAQASSEETVAPSEGQVLGESTDDQDRPTSLLPVEEYYGSPTQLSLEAMLTSLNVTLAPEDVVEAFPAPNLGLGSVIKVYRATPVEVTDWGKPKSYRTWSQTVGQFLEEQKIELGENDRVEPGVTAQLAVSGDPLQARLLITRVAITEVKEKEKIDFKKIEREDPELPRGQTKVTKGAPGERVRTYRVTRENGVEVKRELLKNEVTKEPVTEEVIIGTKLTYGKEVNGRISWYKYDSTKVASDLYKRGDWLEITANGKTIIVKNDGCICSDTGYIVDLHPDHFTALGGKLRDGIIPKARVRKIENYIP